MQDNDYDRIFYWPFAVAVACPLAFVLTWANLFNGSLLLGPVVLLLWACTGARAAVLCVPWFRQRAWRPFLSALILPLTVLIAAVNIGFVWNAGHTVGNYIHLLALYPRYMAEIAELPADKPRFKVWEWVGTTPCASGLAYDESDETGRPLGTWTEPFDNWKMRTEVSGIPVYGAFPALRHFYFVHICPPSDRNLKIVF
jgi:hypothetical protein